MASRASQLALWLALGGCDADRPVRIIDPPDTLPDGAPRLDAGPEDGGPIDAGVDAFARSIRVDRAPIAACDAPTLSIAVDLAAPVEVTPLIDGVAGSPRIATPGEALVIDIRALPEGAHQLDLRVADGIAPGPPFTIDRTAPAIDWPVARNACVAAPPAPTFSEPVEWSQDSGRLGCRVTRRVEAVDACGHRSVARRSWRVGPPGEPTVRGEAAFEWTLAADGCSDRATATLGRVGEPAAPYAPGTFIEWPGDYTLRLTVHGCNGPTTYDFAVTVPPGPCDGITAPLDTAPRVRGWLEIMSERLVNESLRITDLDPVAGGHLRTAATLMAGHPGFPDACPPRAICSTAADRQRALEALVAAIPAMRGLQGERAAARCVAEAARVVMAARRHGEEAATCLEGGQHYAEVLVDAWIATVQARRIAPRLCEAELAARCDAAPELRADSDPVAFAERIEAIGGAAARACQAGDCAALIEETDAALAADDCRARSLLSVVRLLVGRRCAGAGRYRHPGLLALDAALAEWPVWSIGVGTQSSRAHLAAGVAACLR